MLPSSSSPNHLALQYLHLQTSSLLTSLFTSTQFTAIGLLIYLIAWSINFSDDSNSPDFANFFPPDRFCLSPDPQFSLRSPINVSFMETLLSETSRMGDGNLEGGSWRFRGKIPMVQNPDS